MQQHHDIPLAQRNEADAVPRRHVVIGAGAVGVGVALRLAGSGHQVCVVTRSGTGPQHERIDLVAADAEDAARITSLATGAHAIFNCANPTYSTWASAWPPVNAALIAAAESSGARLITMSNVYGYGKNTSPMSATDPLAPPTKKGAIRSAMWEQALEAHRAGRVRVTEVRASDFFGPGVGESAHLGDRFVPRLLAGKSASIVGAPDQLHSWSYIEDVCATLVAVSEDDRSLGRAWHVPTLAPMSARAMGDAICDTAGVERQRVKQIPRVALRLAGVFSNDIGEVIEMLYQFDDPFVIDSLETTEVFGLSATPLEEQLASTIASYRPGGQAVSAGAAMSPVA
ncbi:MAG: NAD-dependent epimerase/dehydratase family protein [Ilumatobacter sp.]